MQVAVTRRNQSLQCLGVVSVRGIAAAGLLLCFFFNGFLVTSLCAEFLVAVCCSVLSVSYVR